MACEWACAASALSSAKHRSPPVKAAIEPRALAESVARDYRWVGLRVLLARFGGLLLGLCRSLARDGSSWVCGCQTPCYSKADASSLSAAQMPSTKAALPSSVSARSRRGPCVCMMRVCQWDVPGDAAATACHSGDRPDAPPPASLTAPERPCVQRWCVCVAQGGLSLADRARSHWSQIETKTSPRPQTSGIDSEVRPRPPRTHARAGVGHLALWHPTPPCRWAG